MQQGRNNHLDEALSKTMTQHGSHPEASKRAGTAYLNLHKAHTYDLTHKTGSYMYMAPEVFREGKYNEKVCAALIASGKTNVYVLTSCSAEALYQHQSVHDTVFTPSQSGELDKIFIQA